MELLYFYDMIDDISTSVVNIINGFTFIFYM